MIYLTGFAGPVIPEFGFTDVGTFVVLKNNVSLFSECQNLASQMVENNISPIAYSLQLQKKSLMKNNTAEVLRNVKLLEQTRIVICSPREEKYKLIKLVLDEVLF